LPQTSVAVQVRVTEYDPAHEPGVVTSAKVNVTSPQASVAVGVAKSGVAGQVMVERPGNAEITGAELSLTVMLCDAVAVLLQPSTAVQLRVMVYEPGQAPGVVTSSKVSVTALPHPSVAVATANCGVAGQSIVDGAGKAAITGALVSFTLIVCDAVEALPQASVAVQVRVIEYEPAQSPGVVTSTNVKTGKLSQASTAFAASNSGTAGHTMLIGVVNGWNTGAVVS